MKHYKKKCLTIEPTSALLIALKSVNYSVGPEGISSILAVYEAIPRPGIAHHRLSPLIYQQGVVVKKATAALTKNVSSHQVGEALLPRNGLNVTGILSVAIGSGSPLYRIGRDRFDCTLTILAIDIGAVHLLMPHGPSNFHSTVAKPYIPSDFFSIAI